MRRGNERATQHPVSTIASETAPTGDERPQHDRAQHGADVPAALQADDAPGAERNGRTERQTTRPQVQRAAECQQHRGERRVDSERPGLGAALDDQRQEERRDQRCGDAHRHDAEPRAEHRRDQPIARERMAAEPRVVPQRRAGAEQAGPEAAARVVDRCGLHHEVGRAQGGAHQHPRPAPRERPRRRPSRSPCRWRG